MSNGFSQIKLEQEWERDWEKYCSGPEMLDEPELCLHCASPRTGKDGLCDECRIEEMEEVRHVIEKILGRRKTNGGRS